MINRPATMPFGRPSMPPTPGGGSSNGKLTLGSTAMPAIHSASNSCDAPHTARFPNAWIKPGMHGLKVKLTRQLRPKLKLNRWTPSSKAARSAQSGLQASGSRSPSAKWTITAVVEFRRSPLCSEMAEEAPSDGVSKRSVPHTVATGSPPYI